MVVERGVTREGVLKQEVLRRKILMCIMLMSNKVALFIKNAYTLSSKIAQKNYCFEPFFFSMKYSI